MEEYSITKIQSRMLSASHATSNAQNAVPALSWQDTASSRVKDKSQPRAVQISKDCMNGI